MSIDKVDLKRLYEMHYASLFYYAKSIIGSAPESQELVDDAFLAMWKNRATMDESNNIYAYLRKTVRNRCINHIKKQRLDVIRLDDVDYMVSNKGQLEEHLHAADLKQFLYECIGQLPEKCREIFILSREENLSYKDIAQRLSISVKTVENQIAIALRKIRTKLADSPFANE